MFGSWNGFGSREEYVRAHQRGSEIRYLQAQVDALKAAVLAIAQIDPGVRDTLIRGLAEADRAKRDDDRGPRLPFPDY